MPEIPITLREAAAAADTRTKLINSLYALERANCATDFFTAFVFLRQYLGGPRDGGDDELRSAFERAQQAILKRLSSSYAEQPVADPGHVD